jgi:type I restriction-modification system DNA methylase subunit/REP element-mobilizing transposase RayT
LKEEEFQEGFIRELFVNILNYTLKPTPEYNIVLEKKNVDDSRKADGAILLPREHAPLANAPLADAPLANAPLLHAPLVIAVIELKSTSTADLDTVETQAFGYKNHHPECVYVITSNFEKLRFYIQNAVDYLEFDLFNLSKEQFSLLWLCLSKDNILNDLPLTIKKSSVLQEENVTKKLYVDYSKFREAIFENIAKNNPDKNELLLFNKTQKLLDRFLFIFFAEDRLLLPPNSISEIVKQWTTLKEELDAYIPLYDRFKKYFSYMNTGYKGKKYDIFPYNGGLFLPDEILDNITIDDNILHEHTVKLSAYDFETDVDVNILGHIFEHSLAEIENVQAKLRGEQIDKQKTKRKKEGIYYTPKYITKYIVENTVGKLCEEKRNELEIIDEEYTKGRKNRKKDTIKALDKKLTTYKNWLLSLTILDPACGSGAFLNQALEFLINEHKKVDELKSNLSKQTKGDYTLVLRDYETEILEKNIYGVDLNEESVEIAKLSLWLRTAQKGRKLSTLSSNIKCGNSLIDDPEVAGEKAFNWQKEFPEIFQEKEKKAWHVTCATHNSRYSQRMFDNHVKLGDPVWLLEKEEQIVTEKIAEIVAEDELNLLAYNICGDHMHLLLVCEEEELPKIVQKIKSISARACNIAMERTIPDTTGDTGATGATGEHSPTREHAPLSRGSTTLPNSGRGTTQAHLWTQKFGKNEILSDRQLNNTIEYIRNNRQKHELPEYTATDKGACSIVGISEKMTCTPNHAFRSEYKGGFDVVIGNPPYVQLQNMKELSLKIKDLGFETYESTGDLYCLFYEKGNDILKHKGLLGYITSNKWMRANYGKSMRKYFAEHTNPYTLIDLGAGIFNSAVVDSNIILFQKEKVKNLTIQSLDLIKEKNVRDFSTYKNNFIKINPSRDEIWTINNPIEKKIKKKIENVGVPLKYWDVKINFGIKTGYNEAFIVNKETKNKLIKDNPKSAELLKPLLRGRDIQRYYPVFAQQWLIATFPAYKINIDEYVGIKNYLLSFGKRLEQTGDKGSRKKTINKWFETQDSISYFKEFEEDLLIWKRIGSILRFSYGKYYCLDSTCILSSKHNKYLLCVFNSKMGHYLMKDAPKTGTGDLLISVQAIEPLRIPKVTNEQPFIEKADKMLALNKKLQEKKSKFLGLLKDNLETEKISKKLNAFYDFDFKTFLDELKKLKIKLLLPDQAEWKDFFEQYKTEINQLQSEISKTDKEIDQMVYELYDLTEDEIKIVEGEE